MTMLAQSARRCPTNIGARVGAEIVAILRQPDSMDFEETAVDVRVSATAVGEQPPAAAATSSCTREVPMSSHATEVADGTGGTDGKLEVGQAGSSLGLVREGYGKKRRAVGGAGNEDAPTRLHEAADAVGKTLLTNAARMGMGGSAAVPIRRAVINNICEHGFADTHRAGCGLLAVSFSKLGVPDKLQTMLSAWQNDPAQFDPAAARLVKAGLVTACASVLYIHSNRPKNTHNSKRRKLVNTGHQKARWRDPENKTLLPTAWVAIGKVLGAIGLAGGVSGSAVIPFTAIVLDLEENNELELAHPSSAAKAIKGKTTAIAVGATIQCSGCGNTQVFRGSKRCPWSAKQSKQFRIVCKNMACGKQSAAAKWAVQ
jgi:hypothetical protein